MRRIYELLIVALVALAGGWVAGLGAVMVLQLPPQPQPTYVLQLTGIFMLIAGFFTVLTVSQFFGKREQMMEEFPDPDEGIDATDLPTFHDDREDEVE